MTAKPFVIGRTEWNKRTGGQGERLRSTARRSSTLSANVRGVPQVVFKVAAKGGCHGPVGLAGQLDYILGKADHVIDPEKQVDRMSHLPKEFVKAKAEDWASDWKRKVNSGHSMHMIASFPRGTDPEKVADIMREVCHDLLDQGKSRFKYIAAIHTDKAHPHAHIVVNRRNEDGEFFYFARNHEYTYDVFKDKIVDVARTYGIELCNSSKLSRGIVDDKSYDRSTALKGLSGELVAHGPAPFENRKSERMSYFVTVKTKSGEKTLWGKELGGAMAASGPEAGDDIRIIHTGKEAVLIPTKDGRSIEVHRNNWSVEVEGRVSELDDIEEFSTSPTEDELRLAEWKREQVLKHAGEYRGMAETLARSYPALSQAFAYVASALERGKEITKNFVQSAQGASLMPADAVMKDESDRLAQTIEQARQDLIAVRDAIDELPPAERPDIEARYFSAIRDMQEAQGLEVDKELLDQAHGTIYSADQAKEISALSRDELSDALKGTGIDVDELQARLSQQTNTAALEAHWVEADARAIAAERGHDMDTDEGRTAAFKDVLSAYDNVAYVASERAFDRDVTQSELAAGIDRNLNTSVDLDRLSVSVTDGQQSREYTMPEQDYEAAVQDRVTELRSEGQDRATISEREFEIREEALSRYGVQQWHGDTRELTEVVEDREALKAEITELSSRENLTSQEERRLVEAVDKVLGSEAANELKAGRSEVLKEFGGREDQLNIAERYLKAEQSHGAERENALNIVNIDRQLNTLDKEQGADRELAEQERAHLEQVRDEGLER